jgi:endonuclease/exonuclease/phosphatase family metal-dependent hydrolase
VAGELERATHAVLLGDLNAPIESGELEPLRRFTDAFAACGIPPGDERRQSMDEKDARIDHVIVHRLEVSEVGVVREAGDASDHWPVIADLDLG